MRADLSPDDFQGLMQTHREQARLRCMASEEAQDTGDAWTDFVILGAVALIVFVAALVGFYGPGVAAFARGLL